MTEPPALARVRLDVWLDVACLFKTRSEAQRACNGWKIDVNDLRVKPHRDLRVGDRIAITRPLGRRQVVVVRTLVETHVPKAQARQLYEDITPPPTAEERAFQDLLNLTRPRRTTPSTPSRRDQRALRRLKEGRFDEPS